MPVTGMKPIQTAAGPARPTASARAASEVAMLYAGAVLETAIMVSSQRPSALLRSWCSAPTSAATPTPLQSPVAPARQPVVDVFTPTVAFRQNPYGLRVI